MKKSEFLFPLARIINDGVMTFIGLLLAYFLRMRWFELFDLSAPTTFFPLDLFYIFAAKTALILVVILALNGRYQFGKDEKVWDEFLRVFWVFSAGMALVLVSFFFAKFIFFSRFIFGFGWLFSLLFLLAGRIGLRQIRQKFYEAGFGKIRILVLGKGTIAKQAISFLKSSPKYEIVSHLSQQEKYSNKDTFEKLLKDLQPHEVLLADEKSSEKITSKLVRITHINHVRFRFLPDELGLDLASVEVSTLGDLPLVTLHNTKIGGWGYITKSGIDFAIASISGIILSPVIGIVAWKVWQQDKTAPIFYGSERVGRKGKKFLCWKFRTMIKNADQKKEKLLSKNERKGGVLFKMENDPRITPLGKKLRKWSLDELPQLWNVLNGEMSLIGPRPHLPEEVKKYAQDDLRVLGVKPGITGFAQINGRSNLSFQEEMNFELFYLKNWSLKLDAIIFLKTILIVQKRKNAS